MNKVLCGDCLEIMKTLEDESVNFVMTSPPYADQIKNYGEVIKKIHPDKYVEWFLPRAKEIFRILADNGSFVLNISDKLDGKFQNIFVFKLVIGLCEEVGFHLVRDYVWYNPATPPNVFSRGTMGRTKKSHEYCFWFCKSEEWTFNMDSIRKPYSGSMKKILNGEVINGPRDENTRPSRHNFDLSRKWDDHGGADPGSVLTISNTSSNGVFHDLCKEMNIRHPARYPEKLVEFFILAGTNPGDTVLDPFSGSGTTAVVAKKLGRNYICIEANPDFCRLAESWIAVTIPEDV